MSFDATLNEPTLDGITHLSWKGHQVSQGPLAVCKRFSFL